MKRYIIRRVLIVKLAALALGVLCFLQTQSHAQEMTGYIVMFPSIGLAPGERLRLTLFNPDGAPVRAQAQLHHAGGSQFIFADGSVRFVRAGISHSFDFDRSDIPLTGEEGTGRLQLRASFYITIAEPRTNSDGLSVSMETISVSDGTSNTVFFSEVIPSAPSSGGGDVLIGGDARDILMGIVPGQTLRVTLFNPRSSGSEAGSETQHNSRHRAREGLRRRRQTDRAKRRVGHPARRVSLFRLQPQCALLAGRARHKPDASAH